MKEETRDYTGVDDNVYKIDISEKSCRPFKHGQMTINKLSGCPFMIIGQCLTESFGYGGKHIFGISDGNCGRISFVPSPEKNLKMLESDIKAEICKALKSEKASLGITLGKNLKEGIRALLKWDECGSIILLDEDWFFLKKINNKNIHPPSSTLPLTIKIKDPSVPFFDSMGNSLVIARAIEPVTEIA